MLFSFSTPVLIRHLLQLTSAVSVHWCLFRAVLLCPTWMFHKTELILLTISSSDMATVFDSYFHLFFSILFHSFVAGPPVNPSDVKVIKLCVLIHQRKGQIS
jgi:hypothetical protein